jgi:hypothetical protein
MQTAISEKETSDLEKAKIDGRLANSMKVLATKNSSKINMETQIGRDLLDLRNLIVQIDELTAGFGQLYDIMQEK